MMMKTRSFPVRLFKCLLITTIILSPVRAQAKDTEAQNQIILLNDSAAALEDSNPDLSQRLTQLADEKEKEWEANNANSASASVSAPKMEDEIKLLHAAAIAIGPVYPLIVQGLNKMVIDIQKSIEIGK